MCVCACVLIAKLGFRAPQQEDVDRTPENQQHGLTSDSSTSCRDSVVITPHGSYTESVVVDVCAEFLGATDVA